MINHTEERKLAVIRKNGNVIQGYKVHDKNNFLIEQDIVGLDANVLVDIVESAEFKKEVKEQVQLNVLKICTTNIALGEARHVLIKKRGYDFNKATEALNNIVDEFKINKIKHNYDCDTVAEKWMQIVKKKMRIKKIWTFPNDLRILSNLHHQAGVNLYITEDTDIEKAVKKLNVPIRIKIIGEASNLDGQKISEFFRQNRKAGRRRR